MCRKKILQVWLHLTWKGKIANLENIVKVVFMGRHCYCTRPFHQYAQGKNKTKQNNLFRVALKTYFLAVSSWVLAVAFVHRKPQGLLYFCCHKPLIHTECHICSIQSHVRRPAFSRERKNLWKEMRVVKHIVSLLRTRFDEESGPFFPQRVFKRSKSILGIEDFVYNSTSGHDG